MLADFRCSIPCSQIAHPAAHRRRIASRVMRLFVLILALAFSSLGWAGAEEPQLKFNRDIRPILSSKCYQCHGPDEHDRKAELRFDKIEEDLADRGVIIPSHPEESDLVARIMSDDPDFVMPPPDAKLELTASEIDSLTAWVRQGAKFEGHWAFTAPQKSLPHAKGAPAHSRNEIGDSQST